MVNADANEGGVYAWMASVRASMANDPCRQLFEDQVQTHAFIFLDDYLEHILAGPKQGPIIELVKTPGRKKNMPRRLKAATAASAKVKTASLFSLDGDNSTQAVVPVNSFHRALLEVKQASNRNVRDPNMPPSSSTSSGSAEKTHERSNPVQLANIPEITVSVAPDSQACVILPHHHPKASQSELSTYFPATEHGTELSVIAEGDESLGRSPVNILPLSTITSNQGEFPVPRSHEVDGYSTAENLEIIETDQLPREDPSSDTRHVVSSPVSLHSVSPGSHQQLRLSETRTRNYTEPLPSGATINSPRCLERNAFTAPLPVVPVVNSVPIPHTISVPLNVSSSKKLAHKSSIVGFPILPAPSPLRKSTKVAQEAVAGLAGPTPPITVPAPVPLGKRTSWLMKAREAKAMEGTSSLPGSSVATIPASIPVTSTAIKRKSGEMIGTLPSVSDQDKDQRKPKVAKSTPEVDIAPPNSKETKIADYYSFPSAQNESGAPHSLATALLAGYLEDNAMDIDEHVIPVNFAEEGFIDLFKRTVEGLGARSGKSAGKSSGDPAVAALAEARAAAEARVAERNKASGELGEPEIVRNGGQPSQETLEARLRPDIQPPSVPVLQAEQTERRLSLSDLASDTVGLNAPRLPPRRGQAMDVGARSNRSDESISTTPPDSPPSKDGPTFVKPAGPVFNKPPPVFMPPATKQSSMISGHPNAVSSNGPSGQFTLPAALSLGIPVRLTSHSNTLPPLLRGTSHLSSQFSIFSDPTSNKCDGGLVLLPSAQDTTYTVDSQPGNTRCTTVAVIDDDDDDDSWPLEEKLAAAEPGWRPFDFSNVDKEDTWSSLPSESQGPTRRLTADKIDDASPLSDDANIGVEIGREGGGRKQEAAEISDNEHSMMTNEVEVTEAGIACLDPAQSPARAVSQASRVSSSQPQAGFFSQATKLVSTVLGGSKKVKPELKSLQSAAAIAKRQKEDADRKTQRLKEMEAKRQVAIAKKEEEEKAKLLEEEKRSKDERKREREENTDRRLLKPSVSTKKTEDDAVKKRKLGLEIERKPESKKHPLKDKKELVPAPKVIATPATKLAAQRGAKAATTVLVSSAAYNSTQNAPPTSSAKPFKAVPSLKGKAKAKAQEEDLSDKLPSTMVQTQMAARVKAQMQAANVSTPEVPSESIELPDINSEYSDSEDEERVRTFDPPDWAQSPELRQALEIQSTVNPDDVFGAIRPLRMDEMFRTRQSRFRARTSSANWSGSDRLTVEEIREYERRMGFQPSQVS